MILLCKKYIFYLFWIIAWFDIIGLIFNLGPVHFIMKPLLMPVLIFSILLFTHNTAGRIKMIGALFFSFLGDVFLLLEGKDPLFFIVGLCCFLVTHIFYIRWFRQLSISRRSLIKDHPYVIFIILAYTASLLYVLVPGLGELIIPVILYACIISTMLYFSLCISYSISKFTRYLILAGTICFVLSDSLLAMNKFYKPFPFAAAIVMFTYCMAQYYIVKGFIRNRN